MTEPLQIDRIHFRSFKAFTSFSVNLRHTNILVGPNNSGKSTVISALRALDMAIRVARARSPVRLPAPSGTERDGYAVAADSLPLSLENVQTDYDENAETTVTFQLSNGDQFVLYFPSARFECYLFVDSLGLIPSRPVEFREMYPVRIAAIPVLGPVEHTEEIVQPRTVTQNLATHRASRNFRNYWLQHPEQFEAFRKMLVDTWPDTDIRPPELIGKKSVAMFCVEGKSRQLREIYWAGFGFQIWCQILTHIVRTQDATLIVIDEPETYLHPDLQRQFLSMIRDVDAMSVIGTHSSEIVAEADASELVIVDKRRSTAKRVGDAAGVREVQSRLGSRQNIALTRLARSRRALYVEGEDFRLLRRIAARAGLRPLAATADIADLQLEGNRPEDAVAMSLGARAAIADTLLEFVILDNDFRPVEARTELQSELEKHFDVVHIFSRKEIENYVLIPVVLQRAVETAIAEQRSRTNAPLGATPEITSVLMSITEPRRSEVEGQYVARHAEYFKGVDPSQDYATIHRTTIDWFDEQWGDLNRRLRVFPGKLALRLLNQHLQSGYGISLSLPAVIDQLTREELPLELWELLRTLDRFRTRDP